jgi:hypothetical protein
MEIYLAREILLSWLCLHHLKVKTFSSGHYVSDGGCASDETNNFLWCSSRLWSYIHRCDSKLNNSSSKFEPHFVLCHNFLNLMNWRYQPENSVWRADSQTPFSVCLHLVSTSTRLNKHILFNHFNVSSTCILNRINCHQQTWQFKERVQTAWSFAIFR